MDALGSLLDGPRARSPFMLRMVMAGAWSVRITDTAPLTVIAGIRGSSVLRYDDGTEFRLEPGQVALVRGTHPYTVGDPAATEPIAWVDGAGDCFDPTGTRRVDTEMCVGVRSWGNCTDESVADAIALIGTYAAGQVNRPLLDAVDRCTVVDLTDHPLVAMLDTEIVQDAPAQEVVLGRLLDLLLITGLRRHMESPGAPCPAWYRAHTDPVVGGALRLLHNNIEHPWTIAELAGQVGVSRAALARRFTESVGEPPMTYLTTWRLSVAGDLLADTDEPLSTIARRVGYSSAFAFSSAFKRHRGVSPAHFRREPEGCRHATA